jgi:hypothetical protein
LPYLQPKVAEDVKRAALRKLFSDPQFNVMDGLDIYIDDYTKPDPMPAGMLAKLGKVYAVLDEADGSAGPVAVADLPTPAPGGSASSGAVAEADGSEAGTERPPGDERAVEPEPVLALPGGQGELTAPPSDVAPAVGDAAELMAAPPAKRSSR